MTIAEAIENPHYSTDLSDPKRLQAVELLARATPKAVVARMVGVDRSTVYEWLKCPAFRAALDAHKSHLEQLITDPTPYFRGLISWKERLPDVMEAILEVALNPSNRNHLRAAEMILAHVTPADTINTKSDDRRIIEAFAFEHGWDSEEGPDGS